MGGLTTGRDIVGYLQENYGNRIVVDDTGSEYRVTLRGESSIPFRIPKGRVDRGRRKSRQCVSALGLNQGNSLENQRTPSLVEHCIGYLEKIGAYGLERAVRVSEVFDGYPLKKNERNLLRHIGDQTERVGILVNEGLIWLE
jgi:hypothetical protein